MRSEKKQHHKTINYLLLFSAILYSLLLKTAKTLTVHYHRIVHSILLPYQLQSKE